MKLVPLGDRVVIKALVAEETTKSGIVLPGQAKEKPSQAEVVAVGPGGVVDGKEVTIRKPKKADTYSEEAGLAMAIVKKWAGNNGNYNNIFREFIPEMAQSEKEAKKAAKKAKKAQKSEE